MIGKAEVFLGTDNYIITNKQTETNKQKHVTRKKIIIILANRLKISESLFNLVKIVIELLIIC